MGELGTTAVLVIAVALFIGSLVKGAVGFGLPLISTPVMIFLMPLPEAVTVNILPVIASNLQQSWLTRHNIGALRRVWPLIAANTVVLLFGSWALTGLGGDLIFVVVGVLILFHAAFAERRFFDISARQNVLGLAVGCGVVSGLLGCVSSFYSFPSNQFLHSLRLRKEEFVLAMGLLMLSGYTALWVGIVASGYAVSGSLALSVYAVMPVMLGMWLGNKVRDLFSAARFQMMVRLVLAATGAALIGRVVLAAVY